MNYRASQRAAGERVGNHGSVNTRLTLPSELIGVKRPENSGIPAPIETGDDQECHPEHNADRTTDH